LAIAGIPEKDNQPGEPTKKGHAGMRPRMALLVGWFHRRGSATDVAWVGCLFHINSLSYRWIWRTSISAEIITHLDIRHYLNCTLGNQLP
jgi:hypothetical protein